MPTNYHQPIILSVQQQKQLLQSTQSLKYKTIILLMLDAGLRVNEVVKLKVKDINFLEAKLTVRYPNKKEQDRSLPISSRLLDALSNYWPNIDSKDQEHFLFPSGTGQQDQHLSRKQVWRQIKKLSGGTVYPHMLRQTFAAKVIKETKEPSVIKALLGNPSDKELETYQKLNPTIVESKLKAIQKETWLERWSRKLTKPTYVPVIPFETGLTDFHIGRKAEIQKLTKLGQKKVNILMTGPQGIGKSHLLDNYSFGKTIRIGDMGRTKPMLAGLLLHLFESDKENVAKVIYEKQIVKNDLETLIYKETIKRMTELLIQITEKQEYTIIVDDVSRIPPSGVNALEKLKNHFHIICAARQVKIQNASFLTNFERVELKPLSRPESIEMINRLSKSIQSRIEDYETFKNHIFENTNGNPLFIIEMIERYSKEPQITLEVIRDYRHTGALKEIDFSLPLVILLSSLMVLRYISGELGDDSGALRLFGGIFLMFALFARNIFRAGKRRYL